MQTALLSLTQGGFIIFDGDARLGKMRIIGRNEGDESVGGVLRGAVAAQELAAEIQAYLMYLVAAGDQQRRRRPERGKAREVMRLSRPSLRISHIGICEPVRMTGLSRPSSMKESAEAV